MKRFKALISEALLSGKQIRRNTCEIIASTSFRQHAKKRKRQIHTIPEKHKMNLLINKSHAGG